jgi:hypothetical protein
MLSRLPINKSEINGNLVRGLLKIVQGEAQVQSSHTGGKNSTGTTTKNKAKSSVASSGPSDQGGAGAKTTSEAAASSTGSHGDEETSAATDRWEILVRRISRLHTKLGEGFVHVGQ